MGIIGDVVSLFVPSYCVNCGELLPSGQRYLCYGCRGQLEETDFHLYRDNVLYKRLVMQFPLEAATALFYFQKGNVAQILIHQLKYKGEVLIGQWLGQWLGRSLKESALYATVDVVVPVPLHPAKLKKRGYNQVALFGETIAKELGIDYVDDVLVKRSATMSQTKKVIWRRLGESDAIFALEQSEKFVGKHLLLVDDIITTGSTIEHCCEVLCEIEGVRISVASMAAVILS